jgi:hypothetical protein
MGTRGASRVIFEECKEGNCTYGVPGYIGFADGRQGVDSQFTMMKIDVRHPDADRRAPLPGSIAALPGDGPSLLFDWGRRGGPRGPCPGA